MMDCLQARVAATSAFQQGRTPLLTGIKIGQILNLNINACKSNKNIHELLKEKQ